MSLFGKLDAANIPTNPFFVEKGEYHAEVVVSKYQKNRDGVRQLYIQYEITEEDSQFLGSKPSKIYDLVDESLTEEERMKLPAEDKKKLRQSMAALKRDLCGNPGNTSQKGLGIDIEDLNDDDWDPGALVGTKVVIGINNYGTDGVNIRWVNLDQD